MIPSLVGALTAGLLGTPHCLGMCGGFATAAGARPGGQAAYHIGRALTYAALGALAGGFGAVLPGPAWVANAIAAALLVWFSAALAGWVPEPRLRVPGVLSFGQRVAGRSELPARFAFGVVNGLLPCGLVYATLGLAVAAGGPVGGALTMLVLGVATTPGLLVAGLGLRRYVARRLWLRRVLATGLLVVGLGSLLVRNGAFAEANDDSDAPACHTP